MAASFVKTRFIQSFAFGLALAFVVSNAAHAQNNNNGNRFFGSVVGGISIDAKGVVANQPVRLSDEAYNRLVNSSKSVDRDVNKATKLRMISLKGLNAAIEASIAADQPLPPEVQFMAGLQRIEFVIASPETNDVILAGPGEGWTINKDGSVVGKSTGLPVIRLEDFLVAMKSVESAGSGQGVSVSIDPTAEGVQRLKKFQRQLIKSNTSFRPELKSAFEDAMGDQTIRLTGVPADSRFSQILVAADYKMKRISMGLEASPVRNMPSLPEIAQKQNTNFGKKAPRFWMECNYQPVAKSADNNVWQLRGQGVKTLTEDSFFNKDGKAVNLKGKTNKHAKRWADTMTQRFDEIAKAEPIFRELRNIMDLSVVAAIIAQENLLERVSCDVPAIDGAEPVSLPSWNVPKSVPSQCSFVKLTRDWLLFTSGGVQIDSWAVAANTESVPELDKIGETAIDNTSDRWWWNSTN